MMGHDPALSQTQFIHKYRGADKSLAPNRKETSTESCQGRARFEQNREANCREVSFLVKQDTEGNSRHYERHISLFPSWSG